MVVIVLKMEDDDKEELEEMTMTLLRRKVIDKLKYVG